MSLSPKILQASDLEQVISFEKLRLKSQIQDDFEAELFEWHAPWRKEALEHYLPLGWSFGLWNDQKKLEALFLAQPQLFLNGMTQSLWIEHLSFSSSDQAKVLVDIAYRLCREKHFQSLLFKNPEWAQFFTEGISVQKWDDHVYHVKTAKF